MKSILQKEKECFFCHSTQNLELHHCIHGVANRKIADREKLVVYLCREHHTGNHGVHHNRELDLQLIRLAQSKYEETHTREEFRQIFGKSYL